ncbi:isoflavone reductase, variant 2 [Blastomyces gilchristii SLH14081]|uniref:Isoflavone reductase n=1 Tax=Blastomyces gilchristii (strain SLH14081) TaxID=559298 RepID=A0A179UDU8_BLAGS|nr:isoflavone reductase [Blastomyces gilchristii SLH14081]XP_031576719.1 isoflavone reductase, variant 1 [Blastomyces gilchristii SLH14081]XP_031576720.1 isoflavone reductase, variant 2 [Blastomyces gilchristii SLH14081]OAT05438.1 isoflavone reductase [Blastomyces gilchristii SLH14081]OAT05439.1 isoflavone reductase, variant 1 [Blastomyces gilchristii SLH14081]OAT05440.1 isoflavone reductase, variant 2 [Blastomyces gilchristii SLH14081]
MSPTLKNVIVVSASGRVGATIVSALLNSAHGYAVSTLSREGSSCIPPVGVTSIKSDYTHDSLVKSLKGQDVVVSAIGAAAVLEQIKLIDAAIEAGVKRFVPSDYGSDTRIKHSHLRVPFFPMKNQVFKYLEERQHKIEWTVFLSGPLLDETLRVDFLGFDIANKTTTFWDERYKNVRFSTARLTLVADAVAQALSPAISPKTANQLLAIRDTTVTFAELLNALEAATGSPWPLNHADLDELVEEGKLKAAKGDFSGVSHMIVRNILDVESGGDFDERGIVSNGLVEVEGWGLQRVVDAVVAEVQGEQ